MHKVGLMWRSCLTSVPLTLPCWFFVPLVLQTTGVNPFNCKYVLSMKYLNSVKTCRENDNNKFASYHSFSKKHLNKFYFFCSFLSWTKTPLDSPVLAQNLMTQWELSFSMADDYLQTSMHLMSQIDHFQSTKKLSWNRSTLKVVLNWFVSILVLGQ